MGDKEILELQSNLARLSGRLTANEFAIKLLIVTHPERDQLKKCWDQWLPINIDKWMDHPGYSGNSDLRDGIHDQLAELASFFDVEFPEGDDDED